MTEQEILDGVMADICARICGAMTQEDRQNMLSGYGVVAYQFMRALFGDEYARGWLESALEDLRTNPAQIELSQSTVQ